MSSNELHVIFGTGTMGTSVARQLQQRGKQNIRMINRSGRMPIGMADVEVCGGDAYNAQNVRELTHGAAVVYQCAQPEYHEWQEKFPPLQNAIIEGVSASGAKLIVVENLYMYGHVEGKIHEGLPYHATTRKGKVRAAMAQQLLDAHKAGKIRMAIARGSNFFGPNDAVAYDLQFKPAIEGKTVRVLGNPDVPHTMTFTEDFAKAMVVLGEHDSALGQVWHVPNAPAVTPRQYATMLFEAAGTTPKIAPTSKMMVRIAGLFVPAVRETVEMYYEWETPFIVDHSKFAAAFGDHATPLREAVQKTVDWFRAHPEFGH